MEEGKRFNEGKPRTDLVTPRAFMEMVKVLTIGAEKYGDRNWEKGMKWSKIVSSLKRHLLAYEAGDDFDDETGLLHSAHIMTNAMFLTEYYFSAPQYDDRPIKSVRIGLDIDDVLADFSTAYCDRFGLPYPDFWHFDPLIVERLNSLDDDFYLSIPAKTKPEDIPFEPVCYITSRVVPSELTAKWLSINGFPTVPVITVGHNKSKVQAALDMKLDVFIDDRYETFKEFKAAGLLCYLMDAKHNRRYDVGHLRIDNVSDVVTFAHIFKRKKTIKKLDSK